MTYTVCRSTGSVAEGGRILLDMLLRGVSTIHIQHSVRKYLTAE